MQKKLWRTCSCRKCRFFFIFCCVSFTYIPSSIGTMLVVGIKLITFWLLVCCHNHQTIIHRQRKFVGYSKSSKKRKEITFSFLSHSSNQFVSDSVGIDVPICLLFGNLFLTKANKCHGRIPERDYDVVYLSWTKSEM